MRKYRLLVAMLTGWVSVSGLCADDGLEVKREKLYHEYLRPQFHITARYWDDYQLNPPNHEEGWISDINGLVYNDGVYHFFAQRWWSAWLHAVSTDLIHWKELRPAFGKGGKFGGTQSGGGVVDINNTSGLGDGTEPPMIAFWSSTDNLNQCISYSLDKGQTWSKYDKNPVLVHPYRDPKVFWYEPGQKWIMVLYGPANESQRRYSYGFNGEYNDAHTIRAFTPDQWFCSAVRLFDNGNVVVTDQNGQSRAKIDIDKQNISSETFRVGAKVNDSEFFEGDIAEILIYDHSLSDLETKIALTNLQMKWNLIKTENADTGIPKGGLVLHLDASKANADKEGSLTLWKDISGRNNHLSQPITGLRPKLIPKALSENSVVRFEGKQFLEGSAVLPEGDDSFTIMALWRRKNNVGSQSVCEQNTKTIKSGRRAALLTECRDERENVYLFFESANLLDWKKLDSYVAGFFECPDMIELPIDDDAKQMKWVLIDGSGDYVIGGFDGQNFTVETDKRKGDYGRNFYATMTFQNMPKSDPRRIQLAWMRGWNDYPKDMPFNQQVTFPCELTLRRLPRGVVMCRYPIREISRIWGEEFSLQNHTLKQGENPLSEIKGDLVDIEMALDIEQSTCSEILFDLKGNIVKYDLQHNIFESVGSRASLEPRNGLIEIRILMDRLSIESYGNRGEVSITNIAYQKDGKASLKLTAVDGLAHIVSLKARQLNSIWE